MSAEGITGTGSVDESAVRAPGGLGDAIKRVGGPGDAPGAVAEGLLPEAWLRASLDALQVRECRGGALVPAIVR